MKTRWALSENRSTPFLDVNGNICSVYFRGNHILTKSQNGSGRYLWERSIIPHIIKPILADKEKDGQAITIRGRCYILESERVIKKTEKDFGKVQDAMTTARKNGDIPRDAFVDSTRQ